MIRALLFTLSAIFSLQLSSRAQNLARFSDVVPGMTDKAIEQQALKIADQRAVDLRCPEDYLKAVIISRNWQRQPDKYGKTIGRVIHLQLYCRFPEGRCAMTDMVFRQKKLSDGSYSRRLFFVGMGDMITVECE